MTPAALGFASKGLGIGADLARLLESGTFGHVELRVQDVETDALTRSHARAADLERMAQDLGVSLSVHALSGINLGEKVGRIRRACIDAVRDQLELAERMRAKWLTLHIGSCGFGRCDREKKRERLALAIDSIHMLLDATRGYDVQIGLENLRLLPESISKCYLGDSVTDFEYLLARLPAPRVGVIFDVGHANLAAEAPIPVFMSAVRSRVLAYHVHWNDAVHDQHAALPAEWRSAHADIHAELAARRGQGRVLIFESFEVGAIERSARAFAGDARGGT